MPVYTFGTSERDPLPASTPQEAARYILGEVDWVDEYSGKCTCPGHAKHTHRTGDHDCMVHVDPGRAPSIFCFHQSCKEDVADANYKLRSLIGKIKAGQEGEFRAAKQSIPQKPRYDHDVQQLTNRIPWIHSFALTPCEELPETAGEHFRAHLSLFAPDDLIWHGDTYATRNIQSAERWMRQTKPVGNFISHSTFLPGANGRKNEFIEQEKFLVVESDEMSKPDQKAVLAWLQQWCGWRLRMVLDTAGKSLHGWFNWPTHLDRDQVKALLTVLKCDTRLMTPSQPSRVAGAMRDGRMQHIIWQGDTITTPKSWEELTAIPQETLTDDSGREWAIDDLLGYDTKGDPNSLLGARWLCRKGSLQIVGESGIGKSSLVMQAAVCWALGLPFFGITPARPLRVLIVQRENDEGDMAEEIQGITKGMRLDKAQLGTLKANLKIIQNNTGTGKTWAAWLETKITAHRAELVFADPLLSFADGDVSKQSDATRFCRHEVQPVLNRTGAALVAAHHTGKPKSAKDKPDSVGAGSYLGLGSSEFTNWFRAVMTLTRLGDNLFALKAEKRGKRAGLIRTDSLAANEIKLRHSISGIFWEQADESTVVLPSGTEAIKSKAWKQYADIGFDKMPALMHDENPAMSQVIQWILSNENFTTALNEIQFEAANRPKNPVNLSKEGAACKLWNRARDIGRKDGSKVAKIVFHDSAKDRWQGVNHVS